MGSLRLALFSLVLLLPLALPAAEMPALPSGPPPLPDLGPVPREGRLILVWVQRWPSWRQERVSLEGGIHTLRERLRDQGEAEARGQRPPWWNLPQRQRQMARLRYLWHLRKELEQGTARLFQVRAVEAQWRGDLEQRLARHRLAEPLAPILAELRQQAEKDSQDKDGSI